MRDRMSPVNCYPVVSLASLRPRSGGVRTVLDLPGRMFTRSGRSALVLALRTLRIGPGDRVLVPNYYCPTLVAPIEHVGAHPVFYPLDSQGLPDLPALENWPGPRAGRVAMFASHLFGVPADFLAVRAWCDERGIPLVEDCAHALFGAPADGRSDYLGDVIVASLPKFVHTIEGGVIAARGGLALDRRLPGARLRHEAKAVFNAFELARAHRAAAPSGVALVPDDRPAPAAVRTAALADPLLEPAALRRVERMLVAFHDDARMVERRRAVFATMLESLASVAGVRPLHAVLPAVAVPYVFPVLADAPDSAFARVRAAGLPVFRWDRYWPGSDEDLVLPVHPWGDAVLQLPCHQDVLPQHVAAYAAALRGER